MFGFSGARTGAVEWNRMEQNGAMDGDAGPINHAAQVVHVSIQT